MLFLKKDYTNYQIMEIFAEFPEWGTKHYDDIGLLVLIKSYDILMCQLHRDFINICHDFCVECVKNTFREAAPNIEKWRESEEDTWDFISLFEDFIIYEDLDETCPEFELPEGVYEEDLYDCKNYTLKQISKILTCKYTEKYAESEEEAKKAAAEAEAADPFKKVKLLNKYQSNEFECILFKFGLICDNFRHYYNEAPQAYVKRREEIRKDEHLTALEESDDFLEFENEE